MMEISRKMMPIGPKSGPKSDQNMVGDATRKTDRKKNRSGATGRLSADPPPSRATIMAALRPPTPPLGGTLNGNPAHALREKAILPKALDLSYLSSLSKRDLKPSGTHFFENFGPCGHIKGTRLQKNQKCWPLRAY